MNETTVLDALLNAWRRVKPHVVRSGIMLAVMFPIVVWLMTFGPPIVAESESPPVIETAAAFLAPAGFAWNTDEDADAVCEGGQIVIPWSFTNTEPSGDKNIMLVEVTSEFGSSGPHEVAPGETINGQFATGLTSVGKGKVSFHLEWKNRDGSDKRSAGYGAESCPIPPTNTPLPTATDTPVPTATPTETSTEEPLSPVPTEEQERQLVCVPWEPVVNEFLNEEAGQWDMFLRQYVPERDELVDERNLTEASWLRQNFHNPTIAEGNCLWAVDVAFPDGHMEVHVYDFGMQRWGLITGYQMPEFWGRSTKMILAVDSGNSRFGIWDWRSNQLYKLDLYGSDPNTIELLDGQVLMAYTNLAGGLSVADSSGEILENGERCLYPEWVPDGSGIWCTGKNSLYLIAYPTGEVIEKVEGVCNIALDPDGSGRGLLTGCEVHFVPDTNAETLDLSRPIARTFGFGSDWGDSQTFASRQRLDSYIQSVSEEGNPSNVDEGTDQVVLLCPEYSGHSLVECLTSVEMDVSFTARGRLAVEFGVVESLDDYKGSVEQNVTLLALLSSP